jgi:2-amino-4-hydroxy-6-hydroxymethyldihydropteridine diphosphokinase
MTTPDSAGQAPDRAGRAPDRAARAMAAVPDPAVRAVLALGSNLGDRLGYLQGAVDTLLAHPGLTLAALSPVYATAPVGGPPQPDYLNAVLIVATTLTARELLRAGQAAEAAARRLRQQVWGPRTLDVDVIVYGDVVSDDPVLTLPHPRARERAFVLAPWLDADPEAEIPGQGRVAGLLAAAGRAGVRRLDDVRLRGPG